MTVTPLRNESYKDWTAIINSLRRRVDALEDRVQELEKIHYGGLSDDDGKQKESER